MRWLLFFAILNVFFIPSPQYAGHCQQYVEWDSRAIMKLRVKSIFDLGQLERLDFYPNGKLKSHSAYACNNCQDNKSISNYCLWTNSGDLDTSLSQKTKNSEFWTRQLVFDSKKYYLFFQVDKNGEPYFLKWGDTNVASYARNVSLLVQRSTFYENGQLKDSINLGYIGNEWDMHGDTLSYYTYSQSNFEDPFLSHSTIWSYDNYGWCCSLFKSYTCVDLDGKYGVDTCYLVPHPQLRFDARDLNEWVSYPHDCCPILAESFRYNIEDSLILQKKYSAAWRKDNSTSFQTTIDSFYIRKTQTLALQRKSAFKQLSRKEQKNNIRIVKNLLNNKLYKIEYYTSEQP